MKFSELKVGDVFTLDRKDDIFTPWKYCRMNFEFDNAVVLEPSNVNGTKMNINEMQEVILEKSLLED